MRIRRSLLRIFTGSDLARRGLPVMVAEAGTAGPTVWLTACAHGDEIGGIVVIHEVFRALNQNPLRRGTLRALPMMNPIGFDSCTRHIPVSEEDLNRSFPGDAGGTLGQRIAARIFARLTEPAPVAVLDLHTDWTRSVPYCVLDAASPHPARDRAGGLAEATGFPVVVEDDPMRHTLTHNLLKLGVAALTLELGESNVVNEENVALGSSAVWKVLESLEMVTACTTTAPSNACSSGRPLRYSDRPLCSTSGILRFFVGPGDRVKSGQKLASVDDAFGRRREVIRADAPALVLGIADSSAAYPGAPVVALGLD
jgi:predicted deacylase